MSTRLKEKEEKIQQIIGKLAEESAKGKPIVVEGKKDELTLRELGVEGAIVTVKTSGKSFLEAESEIVALGAGEVILLLDFDRRGIEGTRRLQVGLEHAGVKVNVRLRRDLLGMVGREIQCVESLTTYLATLQEKTA